MSLSSKPEQELADGGQGGSAGEGTPIDNQTSTVKRVFADYDESETQNMRKVSWLALKCIHPLHAVYAIIHFAYRKGGTLMLKIPPVLETVSFTAS